MARERYTPAEIVEKDKPVLIDPGPLYDTWLYHANYGARLFRGISKSEIIRLEEQGWQDRPVK